VDGHAQLLDPESGRPVGGEEPDVVGQPQGPGDPAGRVVVSGEEEYPDAGRAEAVHLRYQVQARVVVPPVAVEEIACDHHEGGFLCQGQPDEVFEGAAGGAAEEVHRDPLVGVEAMEGAVQVDVGCVQEGEHGSRFPGQGRPVGGSGPAPDPWRRLRGA
jgi:hypothetical protein